MSQARPALQQLWLTEALRLTEEHSGPLEDSAANRQARQQQAGSLEQRIILRAQALAQRDGLLHAQQHWLSAARLSLLGLLLLALLAGTGLGLAAVGNGLQPVNLFWALGSLLGLHLLSLLAWLLGLWLGSDSGGWLGQLWFRTSERLSRDARGLHLGPALLTLLGSRRLGRWALGMLVHGFWLLLLASALACLVVLFSIRHYGFLWETTLLDSAGFVSLTQALGSLPALLGFPLPDAETIRASGHLALDDEAARQAWALWLIGTLLVYGVLPRALLLLLCAWRWRGRKHLHLDLSLPGYSRLQALLQPDSERLGVLDPAPDDSLPPLPGLDDGEGHGAVLVAIELDDSQPWPPRLPPTIANAGVLDDGQQRRRLLDQLSRYRAERLVIACDPRRSPDRGTLALISELQRSASQCRVWLLPPPPGQILDSDRLGHWHQSLQQRQVPYTDSSPLAWLEHGHE